MIYINILLSIVALRILPNRKWQVTVGSRLFIITRQNLMKTILAAEILFVTICRKYTVGDDLRMYVRLFEAVKKYSWRDLLNSKFETGYLIFTWAISELSNNAQFFIVVTGILTVGLYLREIFRKSYDVFLVMYLALTFGFFFFQFSILRQAIAMALFMIAVDKLENRKWIEFILLVLVAGTFHASAFVCLLLVFVSFLPWNDHILKLMWIVEVIVLVTLKGILEIIVYYLPRYEYILSENTSYKLGYIIRIIIICGLYVASVFFCKIGGKDYKLYLKKDDDKQGNFTLIMGSIGMTLMPMINYFESAQRMTYYFVPYVFWSVDLAARKSKWMRGLLPVIYIIMAIYYMFCFTGISSVHDAFGTNDYLFFWQ